MDIINNLNKNITYSKKNGILDLSNVFILKMINYYHTLTSNNITYNNYYDNINLLKQDLNTIICNDRVVIPSYVDKDDDSNNEYGSSTPVVSDTLTSVLSDITVYTSKEYTLDDNILYDVYNFNLSNIIYSDNINNEYDQLSIDRSDLKDGLIKVTFSSDDYIIYDESNSWLTVSKNDISSISFYTTSETVYSHPLPIRVYTQFNGEMIASNTATLTIDRSNNGSGNASATIGDNAILSNNRLETILTLDMFTTGLTPPYNDPEGDLIDAIRIDEISTANVGTFYLNNVEIVTGQIITREDLAAELFTHQGADINTIQSDAFNFSVRDEGSQIWIK